LVRESELALAIESLEASLALELAHGYLRPIEVDEEVGLLAVVGEGMRGTPGLAGRIFTAISRENVNIIAIAQGSHELTISIVVRRTASRKPCGRPRRIAHGARGTCLTRRGNLQFPCERLGTRLSISPGLPKRLRISRVLIGGNSGTW